MIWNPRALVDRGFDKLSERRMRMDRALVEQGHDHERPFFWRMLATWLVGMAAVFTVELVPLVPYVVLGFAVSWAAFAAWGRATAYRSGWLEGRERFVKQMQVTYERGGTAEDWLRVEGDHDMVQVLGLPPLPGRYTGPVEWDT